MPAEQARTGGGLHSAPRETSDRELRERFLERYVEALRRIAERAPAGVLLRALGAPDEVSGLAGALSGSVEIPRARDPLARARARAVEIKQRLLEDAGGALGAGEVAELLGVTPQAVHQRRHRGTLLAVPRPNGSWAYPAAQFDPPEMANRIGMVLSAFTTDDPWTRFSVLFSRAESLGGRCPIDALREGDMEGAVEAVASFGPGDG